VSRSPNKLLASLSSAEYRRIAPRLRASRLTNGSPLPDCGRGRVYFPGTGACSILSRMANGSTIEVAAVGNEGAVGLPALGSQLSNATYVQVTDGTLQSMSLHMFEDLASNSELGHAVDRFCAEFTRSVMQLVACNRLHPIAARCARWILLTYERVGRANFELTPPFLAMAIGAHADELAHVMARFAVNGLVKQDGTSLTVLDSIGLRRASCRCYKALRIEAQILFARDGQPVDRVHRDNVVPMRGMNTCTVCGIARNLPHKTLDECLRAIDVELRTTTRRATQLMHQRGNIVDQSLQKYEKFRKRRPS
jgi:hypothetical protein